MHPKSARLQNAQHKGNRQATARRMYTSSQRSMATEYQDRFIPPQWYKAVVSTTQKDPYRPVTFRPFYVKQKWIKNPPKPAQPSTSPRVHQSCTSAPHNPTGFEASQLASSMEDYTSVYKHDFRGWKSNKHLPCRHSDSLKVNHGLLVSDYPSEDSEKGSAQAETNPKPRPKKKAEQPFESITSYRSDYVAHPLPPRPRKERTAYQSNSAVANDFSKHFKTLSLESNSHSQAKAQVSSPPADHSKFLSTTHAHYIPHKRQHTKPILPAMHIPERSKEPFQAVTTMKEDYKAWETQRHVPVHKEGTDWKKSPFSECGPAQGCTNSKPHNLHLNPNKAAVCNCNSTTTEKLQHPAENQAVSGFQRISSGKGHSTMYWCTCRDRGVKRPEGVNCAEPPQAHQRISSTVSSRSQDQR